MKIEFRTTHQYLSILKDDTPLSSYVIHTEHKWKKDGGKITKSIEHITGLKFDKKLKRVCYLTSNYSISDPLTLRISKNLNDNIDNLTHELIHVILTENYPKIKNKWEKYLEFLGNEPMLIKSHVIVHSMHLLIAKHLKYSSSRCKRIHSYSQHKDYRRAWDIADKIGYEKVISFIK